jgi:hypothetical protein
MQAPTFRRRLLIGLDIAVVVVAIGLVVGGLRHSSRSSAATNDCTTTGRTVTLRLQADSFGQDRLQLRQCDILTVVDGDSASYQLAFGAHEKHISYPGYYSQALGPGEQTRIALRQSGSFEFHDHFRDKARIILDIRAQ